MRCVTCSLPTGLFWPGMSTKDHHGPARSASSAQIPLGWEVECEYNRDGHSVKKADGVIVVPDKIHNRGTPDNLLVIEVKKSNSRVHDQHDLHKLAAFRQSHLQYRHGLFLKFVVGRRALTGCSGFEPAKTPRSRPGGSD